MASLNILLDELIKDTGGFGRFQAVLLTIILGTKLPLTWSMLIMVFAGVSPKWWCDENDVIGGIYNNISISSNKSSFMNCSTADAACTTFRFDTSMNTVVSEWILICDNSWAASTITTIQMAGVLIGGLVCSHISDAIGRKPTYFASMGVMFLTNLVAYFSVSWEMFAAMRFFIGLSIGGCVSVYLVFVSEYIGNRWRSLIVAIPSWTIFAAMLSLVVWLIPDWKYMHLITALVTIPCLLSWWIVPESFRLLATKGKWEEAEIIIKKMAKFNRKPEPNMEQLKMVVQKIASDEKEMKSKRTYSVRDLFTTWDLIKKTLLFAVMWVSCGYGYYAITFGVKDLSGNLFVNMFLISAIEIPTSAFIVYFNNRIGRRWTCIMFFVVGSVCGIAVAIVQYTLRRFERSFRIVLIGVWFDLTFYKNTGYIATENTGTLMTVLALVAKLGVGTGWSAMLVFTSEAYPTVIRTIGYGFQMTAARVGSMVAPQIVYLDEYVPGLMYFLVGTTLAISAVCTFVLQETHGKVTLDEIQDKSVKTTNQYL